MTYGSCTVMAETSENRYLAHATKLAFESEYVDPNRVVDRFIASVDACRDQWRKQTLYAPYLAVVQASMMGKSRLFFRLAERQIFIFYICLGGPEFKGYPKGDPELVNALTSQTCSEGFYAAFLRLLAALEKLFEFRRTDPPGTSTDWIRKQQDTTFWTSILGIDILICIAHSQFLMDLSGRARQKSVASAALFVSSTGQS